MAEPMSPVGFYCDHSDEPYGTGTHEEWEYVDGEGYVFRAVPEVSQALGFPKWRLTPEQQERRCPRAVPVYAVDVPALQAAAEQAIDERDEREELLDKFAYAVAPVEVIGEHTSSNDPWVNALALVTPAAEVDRLRGENARLRTALEEIKQRTVQRDLNRLAREVLDEASGGGS